MSYLNSVTIVGFVGADPEQRQARNNGSKFTVLSVATQRSWKNAQDEWSSKTEWHRICVFRPRLAEYVATAIKKGSHVLVEGAANPNRKLSLPAPMLRAKRLNHRTRLPSSGTINRASALRPRPFFFAFKLQSAPCAESICTRDSPWSWTGVWPVGVGTLARRLNNDSSAETPSSSAANSASLKGISWRMRSKLLLPSSKAAAVDSLGR